MGIKNQNKRPNFLFWRKKRKAKRLWYLPVQTANKINRSKAKKVKRKRKKMSQ